MILQLLCGFSLLHVFVNGHITTPEQMTMVEDVVGTYELESIKKLIAKSNAELTEKIHKLDDDMESLADKKFVENALKSKFETLYKVLNKSITNETNDEQFVEIVYEKFRKDFHQFQSQFSQSFSSLKLFVEHQSSQFQNVLGKSNVASKHILASDCFDLYNLRYNASGSYWLNKFGTKVFCDMETEGGGWLIIQKRSRVTNQIDFNRDWFSYKSGFGDLNTEFWIGNDFLHVLTNQRPYEMRIEMEDYENGTFLAAYSYFRVGNEKSGYVLDIGNYTGNASDSFKYHHGRLFTTKDRDNDNYNDGNCAEHFSGGWWYDSCYDAHLNGIYPDPPDRKNASYLSWWLRNSDQEKVPLVLTDVIIKIRPKMG